ncbi:MAG: hypothetical protein U0232_16375 [Thermomicrobiales bacterium]
MGQLPGPSYPFQVPDDPLSPSEPPERPEWWRGFVIALVVLGLILLGGVVFSACNSAFART